MLQEVIAAILADPKVTSAMTKPRGAKDHRLLQGEKLRDTFIELIQGQVQY